MYRIYNILFLLFILTIGFVHAQLPKTFSYQGILTDQSGIAVPDGDY